MVMTVEHATVSQVRDRLHELKVQQQTEQSEKRSAQDLIEDRLLAIQRQSELEREAKKAKKKRKKANDDSSDDDDASATSAVTKAVLSETAIEAATKVATADRDTKVEQDRLNRLSSILRAKSSSRKPRSRSPGRRSRSRSRSRSR